MKKLIAFLTSITILVSSLYIISAKENTYNVEKKLLMSCMKK